MVDSHRNRRFTDTEAGTPLLGEFGGRIPGWAGQARFGPDPCPRTQGLLGLSPISPLIDYSIGVGILDCLSVTRCGKR